MDHIIIGGDGNELYPAFSVYEAEYATLSGSAASSAGFCGNGSGLAAVGNMGGAPQSTVTLEIDYMTQGQRSFFVSVNVIRRKSWP
jgi:alpha-galactosidase